MIGDPDPARIASALAEYKQAKMPFAVAWEQVVGDVPAEPYITHGGAVETDESFARATYRFMRDAYLNIGPRVQPLASSLADAEADVTLPRGMRLAA